MWQPEPMRHLSAVVLAPDLEASARAVAKAGVLHLMDVRQLPDAVGVVRPYDVRARLADIDRLLQVTDDVLSALGVPSSQVDETVADDKPVDLRGIDVDLQTIQRATSDWRGGMLLAQDAVTRLEHATRQLHALAPIGMSIEALDSLRYVALEMGLVPNAQVARLRESLARAPHLLTQIAPPGPDGRVLLAIVVLNQDRDVLQRVVRSVPFERVEVPAGVAGSPNEALAMVERQLDEHRQAYAAAESAREELRHQYASGLLVTRARLARERLLVAARGQMGTSERIGLLAGWVPASLAPHLERVVREATGNRCLVSWREPREVDAVREGRVSVPILLRNPLLVRPFERVVRNFGLPTYGELEPTPIVALGFLTMFGFMFGDVGQGLVLFALGYFMYRRLFRYRDYAVLLMECGTFSAGFGFLYGSLFGMEHWLPALWLRPLEDMNRLMTTAICFGVGFLSVGLVLNVANAVRRRDWNIVWDRNGILVALAYWIATGLVLRRLIVGPGSVRLGTALLWLAVPLSLLLVRQPLRLIWHAIRARRRVDPGDVLAASVEALVELLDGTISAVSNTATFIRLAAFALSHAGLFLATYSVADALWRSGGGTVGAVVVIVLGNVLVIVLEGLIVSIQALRLEYYEFFSRFYTGNGQAYRPLRLTTHDAAA